MSKHKYLNDLGIEDKDLPWNWNKKDDRHPAWKEERAVYGFDERDSWSMKYTLTLITYERLKYFRDFAPVEMDKVGIAHDYIFGGKELTLGQALDRILSSFANYITQDGTMEWHNKEYREYQRCWSLLGVIMPSLWW